MSKPRVVWLLLSTLLPWLATSCANTGARWGEGYGHFHEAAATDMVLRFYRWDSIYMTKPQTRENGFLPILSRDDIARQVQRHNIARNLAVVVVGFTYSIDPGSPLVRDWKAILGEQGFRRVVFLRASGNDLDRIDGLPILLDTAIALGHDTTGQYARTVAPVPPPAGAHVAHPSSPAVR